MLDFAWYVFSQTGNVDAYLLFKEIEKDGVDGTNDLEEALVEIDQTIQ